MKSKASAIIPAYNEEGRVGEVVNECLKYVEEVIVIDDGSSDGTTEEAKQAGAKVIKNEETKGYLGAIRTGFRKAYFDIIVTLDADGEHSPTDIPRLLEPIVNGRADLVIGKRERPDRVSERLISWLTKLKTDIGDSGSGFRAIKKELAVKLRYPGRCICGISVLEPSFFGARMAEVPIKINFISKKRKPVIGHIIQLFYVLIFLLLRRKMVS